MQNLFSDPKQFLGTGMPSKIFSRNRDDIQKDFSEQGCHPKISLNRNGEPGVHMIENFSEWMQPDLVLDTGVVDKNKS